MAFTTFPEINYEEEWALSWGFFIYRTVYTAESEESWPTVLRKIQDYAVKGVKDKTEQRIKLEYRTFIFDNVEFDGATIEQLRDHNKEWALRNDLRGHVVARSFIVVDDDCLQVLMAAPEVPPNSMHERFFVKLVDVDYDPTKPRLPNPPRKDTGIIKVSTFALYAA
ncbi:hypothetical protein EJ08DRAFT_646651 [Tothia fuscella]|uniref:Uncharacterized protein n=1 Tax=Tothia fuscella TaxID=1048955 RepID=A0A9P4U256_9PEZI|nr:hypothetical protein EJ08DRAFT_646651 [Tothia fuscella]